ncbi:MAG: YheU family protein [Pseudomonadales bacterium]
MQARSCARGHVNSGGMVKISWQSLSEQALIGVIDDFVLREGTDYGAEQSATEIGLEAKRAAVHAQLQQEVAVIWFDPETQSVTIALAE